MTYEDVKRIRANPTAEDVDCQELSILIDEAIERQIPKPGKFKNHFTDQCPVCNNSIYPHMSYCNHCGQKLRWKDDPDTVSAK